MKKTTTSNFKSNIAKYSALSIALAGISDASGQIIFTDVDPDFVGGVADDFRIDFDNDGLSEISLNQQSYGVYMDGPANMVATSVSGYAYANNLSAGTVIDDNQTFLANVALCYYTGYSNSFCLTNGGDGFVGVTFLISGESHFGWVALEGVSGEGFTITGFAYEATPDTAINAGETLSLEDNTIQGFTSFLKDNILSLRASAVIENVTIHNITGQSVLSQKISDVEGSIDISNLTTGIYIATVAVEGKQQAIKIVKR